MKIYLVAGEISGDILGSGLIAELKLLFPKAEFRGLGGELMQAEGLTSLYPLETLSVMGVVEILKHLPKLIKVRKHLYQDALSWGADLMIGIDSPDFTLGLEKKLRTRGVKTVHYVSPSVWAWRQGRIKGIKKSIDLMLTLLPFETNIYKDHAVPVTFVGHPTADKLPMEPNKSAARLNLGLVEEEQPIIALLPGSRAGEVARLGALFLQTAQAIKKMHPKAVFLLPAASTKRYEEIMQLLADYPVKDLQLLQGKADQALQAADLCLVASGTVALEALFCKTPMVVSYKLAPFTWWLSKFMLKTPWVSLPNLLAQKTLVHERLQDQANVDQLTQDLHQLLNEPAVAAEQTQAFYALHQQLKRDASKQAAQAIAKQLNA
ncbi:lipid-A-disaccharide synthase [Marinospirillum insulare]|uniref:Lipid-A-disaccharide synthase n=1 Tax=Marinospirillum insulare TaxID=217169 RepID=A0ABQ5ZU54_9GAMM|nr:lipid-A-disaccharide synthase [Marinospirillum insulare]GLR63669.1 lipid-A-disaccharide synthase [Marinospirillum insulare]